MPLSAPVVFPLYRIVDGKCGCGNENCGRIGKHPRVKWGELSYGNRVPEPEEGAGAGLKTGAAPEGSNIFVVDLDNSEAIETFRSLGDVPNTMTVATPRGAHLYFEHPGFPLRNSASDLAKGVDIRGDGGFVVAAGSPHRSGGTYELVVDMPPAPAPDWLLAWLRSRPAPAEAQPHEEDVTEPKERERRREIYTKYLLEDAPPRGEERRGKGDATLFEVVQRGAYDLRLSSEDVLELVREHYDPRCSPMWGDELEERVIHKSHDAKMRSTRPRNEPLPEDVSPIFSESPSITNGQPKIPGQRQGGIFWDDWDAPLDPPSWLVDGLIPVGTVGCFVAHGSSLKTWTVLSLAAAVAQGVPWLDKYATKKGRALIVDYESGDYELRRRVRLLEGGRVVGLGAWCYPSKNIDEIGFWTELAAIEGVTFLGIDSLAAGSSPGVDENSKDAAYPLQLAARYTEATGASVVFVHHSKKDDSGDARKAVRGSTAIYAAMDWCYGFEAIEETPQFKRMRMVNIKPCMGAKPNPVQLELTDEGLHMFDGEPRLERNAPDHEIQARILLALQSKGAIETKALIAKSMNMRSEAVGPHIDALKVRGEIAIIRGVGYVIDNQDARRTRVIEQVKADKWLTESEIAKAAHVDTTLVKAIIRDGIVARSGEGRFILVTR